MTDALGAVTDSLDFAAFGERRAAANPQAAGPGPNSNLTRRGFTGHEQFAGLNIIHMNGHIYDPSLGRFMQADPLIQAPANAQSWNAYTYVFNNPLAYSDPTGMSAWRQVLGVAIAIVGAYVSFVTAGGDGGTLMRIGIAMAFGAASGYVATGTLRGGVTGAFTAALTAGVAIGVQNWDTLAQIGAQAVTGGIMESLQGGNFGNGFAAAGLTAAVMPQVGRIDNDVARTTVGALAGGTISELTGGKFANGAISGAIQGAMAEKNHRRLGSTDRKGAYIAPSQEALAAFETFGTDLVGTTFTSKESAAEAFARVAITFTERYGVELGANIEKGVSRFFTLADIVIGTSRDIAIPYSPTATATIHTHPSGSAASHSGTLRFVVGNLLQGDGRGDYPAAWRNQSNSYVYAVDGGSTFFDYHEFRNAYTDARKNGNNVYAENFTRKNP